MLRFQFDSIISEDGLVRYVTDGVYCDNSVFYLKASCSARKLPTTF
jgi:hypothetical protein